MSEIGRAAKWLVSTDPRFKTNHQARQTLNEYIRLNFKHAKRGQLGNTDRFLVRIWPGRAVYMSAKQLDRFEVELMQLCLESA